MAKKNKAQRALTRVTDLVLANASMAELEKAQRAAESAGASDEEYSQTFWNARRLLQGMSP